MTTGRPYLYADPDDEPRHVHTGCQFCQNQEPERIDRKAGIAYWFCGAWKVITITPDPTPEEMRAQFNEPTAHWSSKEHEITCRRCGKVFTGKTGHYCLDCYQELVEMGHMGARGAPLKVTPEMEREMVRLRRRKWTLDKIAVWYGVSRCTVQTHLKRAT
jgi:hypothetical protein